ncbi:hypothetical protein [Streptomyces mirabilis]|uniref:hypothetical protein n=1 Tax=Streptomyces mirabilis TaxID=68239 RepID=UPI0011605132|nr:hypothetical protein [Streptomyces mirabilis]
MDQDAEDLDAVSYTPTAPEWARHITRLLFHERACGAAGAGWRTSRRPPKVSSYDVLRHGLDGIEYAEPPPRC